MFLEFPEGATPLHDESDLLIHWVRTMSDLNRVEAENILQAQERYLRVTSSTGWQWFHYGEFQKIHISRLIADRCLLIWGCPYPKWPSSISCNGAIQKKYISGLQEADRGNYDSLVLFFLHFD